MQQHSRNIALSALLVLFSVSACSAAGSSSFSDWLASKTGAALQSEGYDYSGVREYVHQCLKEVNNKNRRKIGDPNVPASLYFESGVTCCDARSHSGNSMGNANIEVGNCKFLEHYFAEEQYVMEAPGVSKMGEFSVQCYLNAASDSCGHPFCDQMVLSAAGGIYYAQDIVLASRPISPTIETSCFEDDKRRNAKSSLLAGRGHKGSKFASKGAPQKGAESGEKNAALANAEPSYGGKKPEPNLHSGEAVIYFGPMTVNSRVHDVQINQGWFEYVHNWDDPLNAAGKPEALPITEFDAKGKHVIDPFTYSLKFYKPAHGSY